VPETHAGAELAFVGDAVCSAFGAAVSSTGGTGVALAIASAAGDETGVEATAEIIETDAELFLWHPVGYPTSLLVVATSRVELGFSTVHALPGLPALLYT
jgi:hypothetical protein